MSYEDYITKAQQERLSTKQQAPAQQPSPAPQRQHLDEAIYVDTNGSSSGAGDQGPEQAPTPSEEPKQGIVERLQQLEADNGKYTI